MQLTLAQSRPSANIGQVRIGLDSLCHAARLQGDQYPALRKETVYLLYGILGSSSSSNLSFLCSGVCAASRRSRIDFGVGNCRLEFNLLSSGSDLWLIGLLFI